MSRCRGASVAHRLAARLVGVTAEQLPAEALDTAAMLVASTVASAAAGTGIASARAMRDVVFDRAGCDQATAWFEPGPRLSLLDAVRLNAVRSSAAASDDSDLRNIVHAGTPATTAALATAEHVGSSGRDVLAAVVCGYEAAGRIGAAITPGFKQKGFHGCIVAIFASAVASGRLLGLDVGQLTNAIALAATSIGGLARAADNSTVREYHDSNAAMLGVEAALAARRGFAADHLVFERRQGYFELYGGVSPVDAAEAVLADLGSSWDILTDMAIKLVPGGHPFHAGAEAAVAAVRAGGFAANDIDSITIAAPGLTELRGPVHPVDLVEMAHSQSYFVAAAAADGNFTWLHATDEKIGEPLIHSLIDRIRIDTAPCEQAERYRQGLMVTVRTSDGRTVARTVFEPRGSAALGVGWPEVDTKFRDLVPSAGFSTDDVQTALAEVHGLVAAPDVYGLASALRVRTAPVPVAAAVGAEP